VRRCAARRSPLLVSPLLHVDALRQVLSQLLHKAQRLLVAGVRLQQKRQRLVRQQLRRHLRQVLRLVAVAKRVHRRISAVVTAQTRLTVETLRSGLQLHADDAATTHNLSQLDSCKWIASKESGMGGWAPTNRGLSRLVHERVDVLRPLLVGHARVIGIGRVNYRQSGDRGRG
jgi:hypothetical protein